MTQPLPPVPPGEGSMPTPQTGSPDSPTCGLSLTMSGEGQSRTPGGAHARVGPEQSSPRQHRSTLAGSWACKGGRAGSTASPWGLSAAPTRCSLQEIPLHVFCPPSLVLEVFYMVLVLTPSYVLSEHLLRFKFSLSPVTDPQAF